MGVLSSSEEEEGLRRNNRAQCPVFLRVKPRHVLEVDMSRGQLQARLELDSLGRFTMSQVTWTDRVRSGGEGRRGMVGEGNYAERKGGDLFLVLPEMMKEVYVLYLF